MPPVPQLRPFYGVRFAPIGPLKDLVCPPYDVISPDEQVSLHDRSPYNAVRVELPFSDGDGKTERYEKAGRRFREWLEEGVLVADGTPSLYVYRQDYVRADGSRGRVAGVIGALELEHYGATSGVLPHERTMPGPIEDRLRLMTACPVNISPIYAIYRGRGGLASYYESLSGRPPDARFVDESGTLHRLWAIGAAAEIDVLRAAIRPGPMVIADGHHRYETALAFHEEQRDAPGGHDAVMCFCVDADAEELVVFPFHRALRARLSHAEIGHRLISEFGGKTMAPGESAAARAASRADHPMTFVLPDEHILVEVSEDDVIEATGDRPHAWRSLDVVALHEAVLPRLFPEGIEEIVFTKEVHRVETLVGEVGWSAGVLLRAPSATEVIDVATAGERMPQKASYFWPKAVTGLVFRSLR